MPGWFGNRDLVRYVDNLPFSSGTRAGSLQFSWTLSGETHTLGAFR